MAIHYTRVVLVFSWEHRGLDERLHVEVCMWFVDYNFCRTLLFPLLLLVLLACSRDPAETRAKHMICGDAYFEKEEFKKSIPHTPLPWIVRVHLSKRFEEWHLSYVSSVEFVLD